MQDVSIYCHMQQASASHSTPKKQFLEISSFSYQDDVDGDPDYNLASESMNDDNSFYEDMNKYEVKLKQHLHHKFRNLKWFIYYLIQILCKDHCATIFSEGRKVHCVFITTSPTV